MEIDISSIKQAMRNTLNSSNNIDIHKYCKLTHKSYIINDNSLHTIAVYDITPLMHKLYNKSKKITTSIIAKSNLPNVQDIIMEINYKVKTIMIEFLNNIIRNVKKYKKINNNDILHIIIHQYNITKSKYVILLNNEINGLKKEYYH